MAKKENKSTNFNEHLTGRYGERGSERRTEFEIKAKAFLIGELIKKERKNAKLFIFVSSLLFFSVSEYRFQERCVLLVSNAVVAEQVVIDKNQIQAADDERRYAIV